MSSPATASVESSSSPAKIVFPHQHVIDSSHLSAQDIWAVMENARTFAEILKRPIKKVPTLRGKVVVTMFYENSTRTRTSFELAAKYLSADTLNFSVSTSSVKKGETIQDTIDTLLAMGADALVLRHGSSGICQQMAKLVGKRLSILNAGDGFHDHPSQGLLDLFTMLQAVGDVRGKKIVIVGDLLHSRVARSNLHILNTIGLDVHVCAPPTLIPSGLTELRQNDLPACTVHHSIETALQDADIVMALRLQLERQQSGLLASLGEYAQFYGITRERLKRFCKPNVVVMHPGPMNRGVEIASDVADDTSLSLISRQVQSGVAVRMALLYLLLGKTPVQDE
ncbi:MAG: aspartate carbamoyltransferase catalytic subunit [Vampirovibrionales bacterium]|nr:aspartate carbamoyltransferase catalytic subunit [Vampirovibrionales bacterium]